MATCSNPGCALPGTNLCSACKTTPYCGPICQTAHWIHHKEECPGRLRKVEREGAVNLEKAMGFEEELNWPLALHHADLAATKLKKGKGDILLIDAALSTKYNSLGNMGRYSEALECAKEWYLLYPTNHTHPPVIRASFAVIQSCGHNKEFFDAALYARTLWETITLSRDSHIPDNKREEFTARGAYELARALHRLSENGGVPEKEKKETGVEAIMLARRALEIYTQLYGTESSDAADSMNALAGVLDHFNDFDANDEEVYRLYE